MRAARSKRRQWLLALAASVGVGWLGGSCVTAAGLMARNGWLIYAELALVAIGFVVYCVAKDEVE